MQDVQIFRHSVEPAAGGRPARRCACGVFATAAIQTEARPIFTGVAAPLVPADTLAQRTHRYDPNSHHRRQRRRRPKLYLPVQHCLERGVLRSVPWWYVDSKWLPFHQYPCTCRLSHYLCASSFYVGYFRRPRDQVPLYGEASGNAATFSATDCPEESVDEHLQLCRMVCSARRGLDAGIWNATALT